MKRKLPKRLQTELPMVKLRLKKNHLMIVHLRRKVRKKRLHQPLTVKLTARPMERRKNPVMKRKKQSQPPNPLLKLQLLKKNPVMRRAAMKRKLLHLLPKKLPLKPPLRRNPMTIAMMKARRRRQQSPKPPLLQRRKLIQTTRMRALMTSRSRFTW